jgi:hypothetical protein
MFLAQREATKWTGMPGTEYPTAKDDLDLNLIQLIKARQGGGDGETKEPDPVDSVDAAAAAAAEEAAAAAEAERLAAELAAAEQAAAEAERLAAEAAAAAEGAAASPDAGDDFGDDW